MPNPYDDPNHPFNMIRIANLFPPKPRQPLFQQQPIGPQYGPQNMTSEEDDAGSLQRRIGELYKPETKSSDEYNTLMGQYPQYQLPGKGQRILAGLAGFGAGLHDPAQGVAVGKSVRDMDYNQRLDDWQNRTKALEPAMQYERYSNANERQLATATANQEMAARKQQEVERKNREKEQNDRKRTAIYEYQVNNKGKVLWARPGGNVFAFDPGTGKMQDTGINSGTLDEEDRINLRIEGNIEAVRERGKIEQQNQKNEDRDNPTNWQYFTGPDGKMYKENRATDEVKEVKVPEGTTRVMTGARGRTAGNNANLPTQQKVAAYNRAAALKTQLQAEGRSDLADLIRLDPGNMVSIMEPEIGFLDKNMRGKEPEILQEYREKIYNPIFGETTQTPANAPSNVPPTTTPNGRNNNPPAASNTPARTGEIKIDTVGTPPPVARRVPGQVHKFDNGVVAKWDGNRWVVQKKAGG